MAGAANTLLGHGCNIEAAPTADVPKKDRRFIDLFLLEFDGADAALNGEMNCRW